MIYIPLILIQVSDEPTIAASKTLEILHYLNNAVEFARLFLWINYSYSAEKEGALVSSPNTSPNTLQDYCSFMGSKTNGSLLFRETHKNQTTICSLVCLPNMTLEHPEKDFHKELNSSKINSDRIYTIFYILKSRASPSNRNVIWARVAWKASNLQTLILVCG